jgi:hypothetical protein
MTVDDQELLDPSASAGTAVAAGGNSAGTGASVQPASALAQIVSREPFLGEEGGENEYDEAAFAESTAFAEATTPAAATGCTSGGADPVTLALMALALASRARVRRRIRE